MTSTPMFDALAAELQIAGMSSDESLPPEDHTADPAVREVRLSGRAE